MSTPTELHHVEDGNPAGPPLVLAGSLGSTLEMWRPQVAALGERFRLIRVDHRGHGGSPTPAGPYRIDDLAADVVALLDRLDLADVAFCGLSMGGMVGIALAAAAPDRVNSLTLCNTTAHFPDPAPWRERVATVTADGTASIAPAVVARWFTPDWAAHHPDAVTACKTMIAGTDDAGYAACCAAIEVWDHRDRLAAITAPTLVIAGSGDLSTPVDPHARTLVDGIPDAHLEVVDAAHLSTVQQPDRTSALIGAHAAR